MFLLMIFPWGAQAPSRAHGRQPHRPRQGDTAGRHCPAARLDDLGGLQGKGSAEQVSKKGKVQTAVSSVTFGAGTRPPNVLIIATPAGRSATNPAAFRKRSS